MAAVWLHVPNLRTEPNLRSQNNKSSPDPPITRHTSYGACCPSHVCTCSRHVQQA